MKVFRSAGSARALLVVPLAVVAALTVTTPAGASSTPTPVVSSFKASPTTLSHSGGDVTLSASLKYASDCTLSVSPNFTDSGLPSTTSCTTDSYSKVVKLPSNATGTSKTYTFSFEVTNKTGKATAPSVAVGVGAAPPPLTFTPSSLDFGTQGVQIPTTPVSVTIFNNSTTVSQDLDSFGMGGTDITDFSLDPGNCAVVLSPQQSCQFLVSFTPEGSGTRTAYSIIADASWGTSGTIVHYDMSGTGEYATVSLTSTTLDFGDLGVHEPSGWVTDTIVNSGSVPLKITSIGPEGNDVGDFAFNSDDAGCIGTITPSNECFFQVQFTPSNSGARSTDIVIDDNTAGSATVVPANGTGEWTSSTLTGSGLSQADPPIYTLNFGDVVFGGGTPAYAQVTITDTSTYDLVFGVYQLEGADANTGDFSFQGNEPDGVCAGDGAAGVILQAGDSCTFQIEFYPAAVGPRSATLYLFDNTDNSDGNPGFEEIELSGTGTS